ncbi:MAG: carboxypeptidase regulatory-like domain-containing protein [Planctomycetes bacterium]|nr:carboxypeptidase regulatory-like domain-containing protein [Planctomycetota bacterium]
MKRSVLLVLLLALVVSGILLWRSREGAVEPREESALPTARDAGALAAEPGAAELSAPVSSEPVSEAPRERRVIEVSAPALVRGAQQPELVRGVELTGRVVDEAGAPLALVRVRGDDGPFDGLRSWLGFEGEPADEREGAGREARSRATTDEDGRFSLRVSRAGDVGLRFRASAYAPLDVERAVPSGEAFDAGTFTLIAGPVLSGRVVDSRGVGVAGAKLARVRAAESGAVLVFAVEGGGPGEPLGQTRADGSFELDILPAGELELSVESPDAPTLHYKVEGALRPHERRDGLVLRLESGSQISGVALGVPEGTIDVLRVFASPRRAAGELERPESRAEPRSARLAQDGSFALRGVRPELSYDISLRLYEGENPLGFAPRMSRRVEARAGDRGIRLEYQGDSALVFTVVDARTKAPVEQFRVEGSLGKEHQRWPYFETGDESQPHPGGRGKLGNLRRRGDHDTANLWITATGYREWSRLDIPLDAGAETELGTLELDPAPLCTVTVLDAATLAPVSGARVTLRATPQAPDREGGVFISRTVSLGASHDEGFEFGDERSVTARTDEAGVARLTSFEGVRCSLAVQHEEHASYRGEPFVCAVGAPQALEVRLTVGGSVRVTLLDQRGAPVAGAKIERRAARGRGVAELSFPGAERDSEVTDAKGEALFRHLAVGVHRFRLESDGMFGVMGDVRIAFAGLEGGAEELDWVEATVDEGGEAAVKLHAPLQLALTGTITEGGVALAGAQVTLVRKSDPSAPEGRLMMFGMSDGPSARTDGRGRYEVKNVKPGTYTARVTHPSRAMPAEAETTLRDGDERLDLELDIAIIEGRVTGPDGKPMARAKVSVERPGGGARSGAVRMVMAFSGGESEESTMLIGGDEPTARTDDDGRYVLRGVRPGVKLIVKAESKGYRSAKSAELELGPNEVESHVDLQLLQSGSIEVRVFEGGTALAQGFVSATRVGESAGPDSPRGMIEDGRARLDDLAPGRWKVEVRSFAAGFDRREQPTSEQEVVVEAGATATARFDL